MTDSNKFPEYRAETFAKWLADVWPRLHATDHGRIVKEVEDALLTAWNLAYRVGRNDGRQEAADKLVEVADWCRSNGFDARARHTTSAAERVRGHSEVVDGGNAAAGFDRPTSDRLSKADPHG